MQCQVCGHKNWQNFRRVLDRCERCGFVKAKNKYFKISEKKLYASGYYNGADYLNYKAEARALLKNFRNRLSRILKYKQKGNLLEIGCAYGFFLSLANEHFVSSGVEIDENTARKARKISGCKIYSGDFLKMHFKNNSFDVVCLFDTIEHLKNPRAYLEKIFRLLKKGGVIVIETGDIDAILPRVQKSTWRLITPPFHLSYFSKNTLKRLLDDIGFTKKELVWVPFYRTLGQTIYRLNRNLLTKDHSLNSVVFSINVFDLIFGVWEKVDHS